MWVIAPSSMSTYPSSVMLGILLAGERVWREGSS